MKILKFILNLIFPTKCIFCGEVTPFLKDEFICKSCREKLVFCKEKICCDICGKPQVSLGEKSICYDCLSKTHRCYKKSRSVVKYDSLSAMGVTCYKDGNSEISGKIFAKYMSEVAQKEYEKIKFDFIIGVAQNRKRSKKRGFSPVDVLCKELSKNIHVPYIKNALVKIKETPKQSSLKYEERIRNLIGSIGFNKKVDISGKRILLVDDVMTTGTTLNENAFVLKENGAKEVCCITFATTIKEPKKFKNI